MLDSTILIVWIFISINALLISLVFFFSSFPFHFFFFPWLHYNLKQSPFDFCYACGLVSGDEMISKHMVVHFHGKKFKWNTYLHKTFKELGRLLWRVPLSLYTFLFYWNCFISYFWVLSCQINLFHDALYSLKFSFVSLLLFKHS